MDWLFRYPNERVQFDAIRALYNSLDRFMDTRRIIIVIMDTFDTCGSNVDIL
jgi:hypothetical protein